MIDDYRLLSLDDLKIDNIDELMKNRDDDIFVVPWGDRYDEIKKYRNDPPGQVRYRIPIKERKIIESIMEEIYFRVYDSCEDEDLLVYYEDLSIYLMILAL